MTLGILRSKVRGDNSTVEASGRDHPDNYTVTTHVTCCYEQHNTRSIPSSTLQSVRKQTQHPKSTLLTCCNCKHGRAAHNAAAAAYRSCGILHQCFPGPCWIRDEQWAGCVQVCGVITAESNQGRDVQAQRCSALSG